MKNVQIKVYDKQTYPTHNDEAENSFSGNLTMKNDNIYITYKDTTTNVSTIVKIVGSCVHVKRIGAMNGNLKFEENMTYKTLYNTPYGPMPIEIKTDKSDIYLLEKGIKIYIEYKIFIDDEKVSDNIFMLIAN